MLNHEETITLIRQAKTGDERAKEKLIVENSSLIKSVAKRFLGRGVEFDDLYQLGALGFLKAVNNFNEAFNVKFSTYAVPMIMGEIKRFLRDDGTIKVSRYIKILSIKINQCIDEYKKNNNESPTVDFLAKKFGVSKEDIILALGAQAKPLSLYENVKDGQDKPIELIDKIACEDKEDDFLDMIMLKRMIQELDERERKVIILRYFSDRTQSEIAKLLGVSQVQVSRIENKIVNKLKLKM